MKTFAEYGIDLKGQTKTQVKTYCPQCYTRRSKGINDDALSVNTVDKTWLCHHPDCEWKGGLPKENYTRKENMKTDPNEPQEQIVKPVEISDKNLQTLTPKAIEWLKTERGISEDTAAIAGLKSSLKASMEYIAFPFYKDDKLVNIKYRAINEKKFVQSSGGEQCFYQYNALKDTDTIIITEGELDCLAVMQAGFNHVLSCPSGAASIQTKNLDNKLYFLNDEVLEIITNNITKVILAMDKDEVGLNWEKIIADRIGVDKCFTVSYPDKCKDANEVLKNHGVEKLAKIINKAKNIPVAGIADFKDFEAEINNYYHNPKTSFGLSTGFQYFDMYFRLRTATLNVITGIPSSGKSEFLDQLMINSIRNHQWKWALFSPENFPIASHFGKLAEKVFKKPMFKDERITEEEKNKALLMFSEYIKVLTIDENGTTIDDLLHRLKVCVVRYKVSGFILDPVNELSMERKKGVSETEYLNEFLSKVRNFGRLYNVAMFIVAHPTKLQKLDNGDYPVPTPYDINGSAAYRNKADTCLSVWRSYKKNDGVVQIHIQKMRDKNMGRLGSVEMLWHSSTGIFTEIKPKEESPDYGHKHPRSDDPS